MWVAHLLTVLRLPLAALFWLVAPEPIAALAVLVVAALTDVLDGRVARRAWRRMGRLGPPQGPGGWLDPVCDKTFVLVVLAALWVHHRPEPLLLVAIAARELVLVPLTLLYKALTGLGARVRVHFRAGPVGKLATAAQFVAVTALLFGAPAELTALFAGLAGLLGLVAAGHYLARVLGRPPARRRRPRPSPDGGAGVASPSHRSQANARPSERPQPLRMAACPAGAHRAQTTQLPRR